MERFGKTRHRRGFTIAEVLVVVAILAILLTFAAPAVIGGFVRMHLASLDNSACSIFAAAQNNLTAMTGNGSFEQFAAKVDTERTSAARKSRALYAQPNDFNWGTVPADSANQSDNLRYLDSGEPEDQTLLEQLLPGGSIESKLTEHRYIVEFNYQTGAVYAVWYSDEDEFDTDLTTYNGTTPRKLEDRRKHSPLIGYYGGSGVDYTKVGQMPVPQLTLTNAEELRLRITIPTPASGSWPAEFDTDSIGLKVTVTGVTSGGSVTIIDESTPPVLLAPEKTATIVLDTLDPTVTLPVQNATDSWDCGMPFHMWLTTGTQTPGYSNLPVPGEDIIVTVTTYYTGAGTYLSQSASATCNSLFAAVKETTPAPGASSKQYTASIAYGRHLQNLDAATSGVNASGAAAVITAAEQVQEIDFTKKPPTAAPGAPEADPIYYWFKTYGGTTGNRAPAFTPIQNDDLQDYNGGGLFIRNINLACVTASAASGPHNNISNVTGLFGYWAGTGTSHKTLRNIVLVDAWAHDDEDHASLTGTLAGALVGVEVRNCQSYLETDIPQEDTVDLIEPDDTRVYGGSCVGGLVGYANNSLFYDCSASTVAAVNKASPDTDSRVGGLIGQLDSDDDLTGHVERCYAASYLRGRRLAGGLIGYAPKAGVLDCYAAGIIAEVTGTSGGHIADGLAAGLGIIDRHVKNSYAAVRYGSQVAAASQLSGAGQVAVYGAKRDETHNHTTAHPSVYYVSQPGVVYRSNDDATHVNVNGTPCTSSQLSELLSTSLDESPSTDTTKVWYQLPAEETTGGTTTTNPPYATIAYHHIPDTKDLSAPYPYPQLLAHDADGNPITTPRQPVLHYGDWLEVPDGYIAYCEQYKVDVGDPDEYGVYAWLPGTTEPINTLKNDDRSTDPVLAVSDAYGFLVPSGGSCPGEKEYTNRDKDGNPVTGTMKPVEDALGSGQYVKKENVYKDPDSGVEYDFYPYTFTPSTGYKDYYSSIALFGQTYWFNPNYACEIVQASADPSEPLAKPTTSAQFGNTGAAATDNNYAGQVIIRTARQLANLGKETGSKAIAKQTFTTAEAADKIKQNAQLRDYVQLLDIDYSQYTSWVDTNGDNNITDADVTGKTSTPAQTPAALVRREDNANLTGSYNGCGYRIEKLYIHKGDGDSVGLFGELGTSSTTYGGDIKNITLVDVVIDGTGGTRAGALAGYATNSTPITNCGVYVSDPATYDTYKVYGSADAGGLFGHLGSSTKVENCYAAVKVEGTGYVGGFAGRINGSQGLKNCYAGGHTVGGVYQYNTVNVKAEGDGTTGKEGVAGGFAGRLQSNKGSVNYTGLAGVLYSTCSVSGSKAAGRFAGAFEDDYKGTILDQLSKPDRNTATIYGTGIAFNSDSSNDPYQPTADEPYLADAFGLLPAATAVPAADSAIPYDGTDILGTAYPYAAAGAVHHGDWPAFEGVFYWERENNSTTDQYHYAVHAAVGGTTGVRGELCSTYHTAAEALDHEITNWGYGLFSSRKDAAATDKEAALLGRAGLDDAADTDANTTGSAANTAKTGYATVAFDGKTAPALVTAMVTHADSDNDNNYTSFTLTTGSGVYFELDRRFADAVDVAYTADKRDYANCDMGKSEAHAYQIRTVRQLDNIPGNSSRSFAQTHDLYDPDYTDYENSSGNYFAGTYNGNRYRILDLDMSKAHGLFSGAKGAELQDIILYAPSGKTLTTTGIAGGLVGSVSRGDKTTTITNCIVAGYTMSTNGSALGGLVGYIGQGANVKIEKCAAVNTLTVTASNKGVGGLIGEVFTNNNLRLEVNDCYAGGEITGTAGATVTLDPDAYVSGITGKFSSSIASDYRAMGKYTNVYSYVDMHTVSGTEHVFGIGRDNVSGRTPTASIGITYDACRYLIDCLPTTAGVTLDPDPDGVTRVSSNVLEALAQSSKQDAVHTFVPDTTSGTPVATRAQNGLTDRNTVIDPPGVDYPYPAVVTGYDNELVHYGDWDVKNPQPGNEAEAVFYWEAETVGGATTYHFHAVGFGSGSQLEWFNSLCTTHHDTEAQNRSIKWGYGVYTSYDSNLAALKQPFSNKSSIAPEYKDSENGTAVAEAFLTQLFESAGSTCPTDIGADTNVALYKGAVSDSGYIAVKTADAGRNGNSYYGVNLSFGDAIRVMPNFTSSGSDSAPTEADTAMGTDERHAYHIRTAQQLDNIPDMSAADASKYYVQSHDVYGIGLSAATYTAPARFIGQYDGQSYRILDLNLNTAGSLLGSLGQDKVGDNTTLKNIILYASTGSNNTVTPVAVTGGNRAAGGLAAMVESRSNVTIDNCFVAGYTFNTSSNSNNLGGLVGLNRGHLTIRNSAAVNTMAAGNFTSCHLGGLVGELAQGPTGSGSDSYTYSLSVTSSYAGGTITATNTPVSAGGIVGSRTGTAVLNSANFTNVYSYTDMSALPGTTTVYGICQDASSFTNCYYLTDALGAHTAGERNTLIGEGKLEGVSARALKALKTDPAFASFGGAAHTYLPHATTGLTDQNSATPANPYPYPAVVTSGLDGKPVHYGDWPTTPNAEAMFYWEAETDGSDTTYHFHAVGIDKGQPKAAGLFTSDLCGAHDDTTDDKHITAWGYGVYARDTGALEALKTKLGTVTEINDAAAAKTDFLAKLFTGTSKPADVTAANVYLFKADASGGYLAVESEETSGTWYELDPRFGNALMLTTPTAGGPAPTVGSTKLGGTDNAYEIRTAEQLDNIPDASDKYYKQTHDVYGARYDTYSAPANSFNGQYNGQSYRILDLDLKDGASLFRDLKGTVTLENIILYASKGDLTIGQVKSRGGGLTAEIEPSAKVNITNCFVAGYTFYDNSNSGASFGGLVGKNEGTLEISSSAAVNDMTMSDDNACTLGGLVGELGGNAKLTVTKSYAGGKFTVNATKTTPPKAMNVGGIVGLADSTTTTWSAAYNAVYSYVDMTDVTIGGEVGTLNCYGIGPCKSGDENTAYTACCYLNDRLPDGQTAADETATNVNGVDNAETLATTTTELFTAFSDKRAAQTYVPGPTNGLEHYGNVYPYPAAVTGGDATGTNFVHYGLWTDTLPASLGIMVVYNSNNYAVWLGNGDSYYYDGSDLRTMQQAVNENKWDSGDTPSAVNSVGIIMNNAYTFGEIDSGTSTVPVNLNGKLYQTLQIGGTIASSTFTLQKWDSPSPDLSALSGYTPSILLATNLSGKLADYSNLNNIKLEVKGADGNMQELKTKIDFKIPPASGTSASSLDDPEIFGDTLYCTCQNRVKCTEGDIKETCPLCSRDYTLCQGQAPEATPETSAGDGDPDAPQTPETATPESTATPETSVSTPETSTPEDPAGDPATGESSTGGPADDPAEDDTPTDTPAGDEPSEDAPAENGPAENQPGEDAPTADGPNADEGAGDGPIIDEPAA